MKRKFMCLLLALVTVFSCFAAVGCSSTDEETLEGTSTDEAALTTVTLTLWIPTYENTTDEAILAVQEAMNKITKAKFETAIELHAIPYDEYEEAINARLTEIEEAIAFEEAEAERKRKEAKELAAQGITTAAEETTVEEETSAVEEETFVNDIGMTVVKYPEVEENQMDIFLVQGYDNYLSYIEREALSELDGEINGTSKLLKQYIYPTFLSYAKVDGSTYAIPNNHVVGEYKYLLVNKRLVDELYFDPDELTTLPACKDFVLDVKKFTDVTPMLAAADAVGMHYWSKDGEWSLLGTQFTNDIAKNTYSPPKNIFTIKNYVDTYSMMKHLEENDCIAKDPSKVEEFGVAVISGDYALRTQYEEDYYVYVYDKPMFTTEDIFGSMFAVSAYTKSVARSMEILTMLNTTSELRTILQYGVEGVHWEIDESNSDVIKVISKDYKMNLVDTGNTYMTYPAEGVPMEYWETCKKQNLDTKESPYICLSYETYYNDETKPFFDALATTTKEYKEKVEAMSAEEFDTIVNELKKEINGLEAVSAFINAEPESGVTPGSIYLDFYNNFKK